jgi:hypothetical protein
MPADEKFRNPRSKIHGSPLPTSLTIASHITEKKDFCSRSPRRDTSAPVATHPTPRLGHKCDGERRQGSSLMPPRMQDSSLTPPRRRVALATANERPNPAGHDVPNAVVGPLRVATTSCTDRRCRVSCPELGISVLCRIWIYPDALMNDLFVEDDNGSETTSPQPVSDACAE